MFAKIRPLFPILLLTCGHGVVDSHVGLLQVLAPGLASFLDAPLGDIVMLVGAAALVTNLVQPLAGFAMEKRNLSWLLWFSVALSSLPVLMGHVPGYWSLAAIIVLGAAGTGLYHPEAVLSAHDAVGDQAYLGIPLFMAGGAAIYAVVIPLSLRLSETHGFPSLIWLGIPGLVVAGLFFRQHRGRKRRHPSQAARPRSRLIGRPAGGALSFWPLFAVGCCFCVGSGLFMATLSSHYELTFGPSARSWSGWVLMVVCLSGSLCSFMWGSLSRRHNFYLLALITQLLAFPLFLLLAYPSSPAMGLLLAVPLGMVNPAAIHPAAINLSHNAIGTTQAMRTSLMIGGAYGLSSLAVIAAGALLRHQTPSRHLILFIAACSLLAAGLSLWQLLAHRRAPVGSIRNGV